MRIDCGFPGGNIIVDGVEGDVVRLRQDRRDTEGWWFHWCFRVRGASGRRLTFHFGDGDVLGVTGPAASTDGGKTWRWLGREVVEGASFSHLLPLKADEVRYGFTMPYVESNLREFLRRPGIRDLVRRETLCRSRKGREVELLFTGRTDSGCTHRVLLTCRHHACEAQASFALEGIMEAATADDELGRRLRERVEFAVVPFMDKDGVEDGDQGKNRRPHDHNRDYAGESIYPEVRRLRKFAPAWAEGKLRLTLDLHCPWIRGPRNECIYFVSTPLKEHWERLQQLSAVLESVEKGPLPYRAENNLPFGEEWNTNEGPLKSNSRWGGELPGVLLGTSLELPYARADGETVTPEKARAFGRDLAAALDRWLAEAVEE